MTLTANRDADVAGKACMVTGANSGMEPVS